MTAPTLTLQQAGPALSVQDVGFAHQTGQGLSMGGAADRMALFEAAALLGLDHVVAGVEMAGFGGTFTVSAPTRLALTGAPMRATLDGTPVVWNATLTLLPGQVLQIGAPMRGSYGYLTPAGGVDAAPFLGSRSTHLAAGIGSLLRAGDTLPVGPDDLGDAVPNAIRAQDRFGGGSVRVMPGNQTDLFDAQTIARAQSTRFRRAARANRQGVGLDQDGDPFQATGAAGLTSDFLQPGDIQMAGQGEPIVLLCECQTIGGYPRLGTVIPDDLPIIAQAEPGATLSLQMLTLEQADALWRSDAHRLSEAKTRVSPMLRDPHDIADLLGYQLVGGVTRGDDLDDDAAPTGR